MKNESPKPSIRLNVDSTNRMQEALEEYRTWLEAEDVFWLPGYPPVNLTAVRKRVKELNSPR